MTLNTSFYLRPNTKHHATRTQFPNTITVLQSLHLPIAKPTSAVSSNIRAHVLTPNTLSELSVLSPRLTALSNCSSSVLPAFTSAAEASRGATDSTRVDFWVPGRQASWITWATGRRGITAAQQCYVTKRWFVVLYGWETWSWQWGKKIGWERSRIAYWGRHLELRGKR